MADSSRTIRLKLDADGKGITKATKDAERDVDRLNKSVDKKFRDSGDKSGKSFGSGLKKWFGAGGGLSKIGESGGTVFGSGFLGAIKTPVLGPAILGLLAGAVAVAAPAAGAVAASGLVLGFGAGLAGLGLVTAAKSKVVKDAWSKTLDEMGAETTRLSKPYEKTLVSISGFTQRTFDKFVPSLEASFKETAPAVERFVDQVGRGLERLVPAVRPLSEAFDAVLASLGPAIDGAIGNVSSGLQKLAESVKRNPDGLADLVDGMGQLTDKALGLISALNNANGAIERLTGGTSAVDLVFGKANSKVGQFLISLQNALPGVGALTNLFGYLAGSADKATGAVGLTGDAVKYYTQGLDQNQVAAILAGNATAGAGAKAESAATKFNRQKGATDALVASMFRLQNLALGLSGAQINYQSAVDAATASLKENGRTTDINTEKGRANRSALDNVAASANAQTQAMIESGKGTAAAGRSAEVSRANFVNLAVKMGYSRGEAVKLAAAVIAIPPKKNTNVTVSGAAAAKTNVDRLANSIKLLPNYKTIQIRYTASGVNLTTPSGVGRASGGLTQPKRRYLMGERGAEIAEFGGTGTGGPKILSAEMTRRELTSSQAPIINEIHIEVGGEVVRVVRSEMKQSNRDLKRTVGAR